MSVDDSKSSFPYMWFYNPDGLRSTAGWSFQRGEAAGSGQEQPDIITVSLSRSPELSQRAQGAAEGWSGAKRPAGPESRRGALIAGLLD